MYCAVMYCTFFNSDLCSQLLFIHAFTGCDTTSPIFCVGKQTAFQKLVNCESTIQSCANVFLLRHQARNVIKDHGTKAMAVFGGKSTDSLAYLPITFIYNCTCTHLSIMQICLLEYYMAKTCIRHQYSWSRS